jgi:hypothetical protein
LQSIGNFINVGTSCQRNLKNEVWLDSRRKLALASELLNAADCAMQAWPKGASPAAVWSWRRPTLWQPTFLVDILTNET